MNVDDFARRCLKRIAQTRNDDTLEDWRIFTAMLRATADYVPNCLRFDDAALRRGEDYVTRIEAEQVDPKEDRRRLTPHAETLANAQAEWARIHVLRALWQAFSALFAAEDATAQAAALDALRALADEYPHIYWSFDVQFHPRVTGQSEAAAMPEYQRYQAHFSPPETWPSNGGQGMVRSIFPPGIDPADPPPWNTFFRSAN